MNCAHYDLINCISGIFSAVGTVGAVLVSLGLAIYRQKPRISALFVCGAPTKDQPVMLIQNTGELDVVLKKVVVYYDHKKIGTIDFTNDDRFDEFAFIKAKETKQIPLPSAVLQEPKTDGKRRKTLKLVVYQQQGKKYRTKEKITNDEMMKMCFCFGISSNINHL